MEKRNKSRIILTLLLIILCLAVLAGLIWLGRNIYVRISDYGNSATIDKKPEEELPEEEIVLPEVDTEKITIPLNVYSADGFFERNGLKRYYSAGIEGVPGIDVSSHQTQIDWESVKNAGVEFAMIRLGYRGYVSGELALDECFAQNMEGAASAGIPVGVYFFSQALNEEEAIEEAEFVLQWVQEYDLQYPIMFDWEEVEAEARTDEMNMVLLTACTKAFCETISEAGYDAGVYFNQAYGYLQLNLQSLEEYTFWLAEYRDVPEFAYAFQMWQYSCTGTVPGIEGPVDLNIAFRPKKMTDE